MPTRQLANPYGAFGQPLFASAGVNEQLLVEVVNNTGGVLVQGMVMVWDVLTALNTTTPVTVSGAQSATVASFTLTGSASTASYPANGLLSIPAVNYATTGIGALNGFVGSMAVYYGALSGSTFTGAQVANASATNGLLNGQNIYPEPSASVSPPQGIGLAATTVDSCSGRYATFSSKTSAAALAAADPLVCGVVSPTGDAGTNGQIIGVGQPFIMCVAGVARVFVGAGTVAALALLTTSGAQVAAGVGTGTLENTLGIALEANTAKDTNNTIRTSIKLA